MLNSAQFYLLEHKKGKLHPLGHVSAPNFESLQNMLKQNSSRDLIVYPVIKPEEFLSWVMNHAKRFLLYENLTLEQATKKAYGVIYERYETPIEIYMQWAVDTKNLHYFITLKGIQENL